MAGQTISRAENTNLFGSDYRGFDLDRSDPELCRTACAADQQCRAYTYMKPGIQGPNARCYLKNPVPPQTANECCVSGVKTSTADTDNTAGFPNPFGNLEFKGPLPTTLNIPGAYPAGAVLFYKQGDIDQTADRRLWSGAPDPVFYWSDAKRGRSAGAALWQVASRPFAPFTADGPATRTPVGLVASGIVLKNQHFTVKIPVILAETRRQIRQPTLVFGDGKFCTQEHCDGFRFVACGGTSGRGELFNAPRMRGYRLDWCKHFGRECGAPAATLFCREKGYERAVRWAIEPRIGAGQGDQDRFTFYVRIIPLNSPAIQAIVGQPSNVIPLLYNQPEIPPNFRFYTEETSRTPGPGIELTALRYRAWHYIGPWPKGCKVASGKVRKMPPIIKALSKLWNFSDGIYDKAKKFVINTVDSLTFGVLPKDVWSFSLDVAMMYAGVPPDLPNLKDMVAGGLDPKAIASGALEQAASYGLGQVAAGGVDFLAAKMADSALETIPPGSIIPGTGHMLSDIVLGDLETKARGELENKVRHIIEDPARSLDDKVRYVLETRARQALTQSTGQFADIIKKEYKYCTGLNLQPTYFATVKNTSGRDLPEFSIEVSDSEGIFETKYVRVMLRAGQTMTIPLSPDKKIVDMTDRWQRVSANESDDIQNWWDNWYNKRSTVVIVRTTGDYVCRDPLGPQGKVCEVDMKSTYVSPTPLMLNVDHALVQ